MILFFRIRNIIKYVLEVKLSVSLSYYVIEVKLITSKLSVLDSYEQDTTAPYPGN